jgi:hypothetical protein
MALAAVVGLGLGMGAKTVLGFSSAPGLLPGHFREGSWGGFGVGYLVVAALLGVGLPLRFRPPPQA